MSKINILDKIVYSLISAGEVVEKPASVVKELIENSIDAKSTSISIEVLNGGISKIKVSDNGSGIEEDDLENAFLPHATSKIKIAEDLEKIGTLGFRGEALSSIATVSKVTAFSKTENSDSGNKIEIIGGEFSKPEPFPCTNGTTIIVENLFFNTPARLKFLRKPKQEENEITNYISRLILAHPNIAFKYIADGKMVYQSFGNGSLFDAIYCIYGKSVENNLIEINCKNENYEISGFIGKPTFTKPNRTYQSLFVNGRYIINQQISLAIFKAFENFLTKGTFPFFVLNLKLDLDKVDVNVHPNKLDVKFENSNEIFNFFYSNILNSIITNNSITNLVIDDDKPKKDENFNFPSIDPSRLKIVNNKTIQTETQTIEKSSENNLFNNFSTPFHNTNIDRLEEISISDNSEEIESDPYNKSFISQKDRRIGEEMHKLENFLSADDNNSSHLCFKSDGGFAYELAKARVENEEKKEQQTIFNLNENIKNELKIETKIIGIIFKTYILVQNGEEIFIIDQHAAHERILYDKFVEMQKNSEVLSQNLLVPFILNVNHIEDSLIKEYIPNLNEIGFDIENFGNCTYKINAIPIYFKSLNLEGFFNDILKETKNQKFKIDIEKTNKNYIAKTACKNAVKANDELSQNEVESLLNQFKETTVLLCPHGRPIIIKITKKEIEKWFKRIV